MQAFSWTFSAQQSLKEVQGNCTDNHDKVTNYLNREITFRLTSLTCWLTLRTEVLSMSSPHNPPKQRLNSVKLKPRRKKKRINRTSNEIIEWYLIRRRYLTVLQQYRELNFLPEQLLRKSEREQVKPLKTFSSKSSREIPAHGSYCQINVCISTHFTCTKLLVWMFNWMCLVHTHDFGVQSLVRAEEEKHEPYKLLVHAN